jgi:tetratricopeptide (TPR) repeat protein
LWHGIFVVFFHTRTILCNGESFEELYEKARLASLKGNSDLALFYFERMHRTAPRDEDVIYQLGKAYLETGRTLQAKKLFRKYLSGPKAKWAHEVKDLMGEGISA